MRVLGANDRIGIGFIGFGLIGKQHVTDFKKFNDVNLIGMCDVYKPRLEDGLAYMGNTSAKGYGDFRKLCDNKDIQGVIVATPDHWHALITILACAAGKDVYVEKPMTVFIDEGKWMIQAARHGTGGQDTLAMNERDWLESTRSRKQPVCGLEGGHRVATACNLANMSLRLGRSIRWDPEKEQVIGDKEAAAMCVRPYRAPWDSALKNALKA
jgi:hypothetical protein